ncbi:hypothetical protein CF5_0021 [Staphylococcus phage CF5]|uniref:Uncharacterized protein n=1 Tax=Staphylococcus phage CF5 TaxID=3113739 RepID=A0AAX4J7S4_9CAUD|nr:hypothetical protein CF5_0021 [Staphylococcus phage CF5]
MKWNYKGKKYRTRKWVDYSLVFIVSCIVFLLMFLYLAM